MASRGLLRANNRALSSMVLQTTRQYFPQARVIRLATTRATILRPYSSSSGGAPPTVPDGVAEGKAQGRTGGGEPLESSSDNAARPPKVANATMSHDTELSAEQQREVDQHNKDFDKRADRGNRAPEDKVNKQFWTKARNG